MGNRLDNMTREERNESAKQSNAKSADTKNNLIDIKKYTKEEYLKAAEIGEVSMIDAKHTVSLLDEAKRILAEEITNAIKCKKCGKVSKTQNGLCYGCYQLSDGGSL